MEILARLGEPVDSGIGRLLTLESGGHVWYVEHGHVDVFATTDGGRWHFLYRAGAGTVLCGAPTGGAVELIAKPLPQGRLRRIALPALRAGIADDPVAGDAVAATLAAGLDAALAAMSGAIRDGLPPRVFAALDPGSGTELAAGSAARSVDGVIWVEVLAGAVHRSGTGAETTARQRTVLGEADWLESEVGAVLHAYRTLDIVDQPRFWGDLDRFVDLFLRAVAGHLARRDTRMAEEIVARRDADEHALERSTKALAAALEPVPSGISFVPDPGGDGPQDRYLTAARIVAADAGFTIDDVELQSAAGDSRLAPLDQIAVAAGFRTREIRLDGDWWRTGVGPLVGHRRAPREPVALLWRRGGYRVVEPGSTRLRTVDRKTAELLEPVATMVYRPLPDKPVTGLGLLRFASRGNTRDLATVVGFGMVAAVLGLLIPVITGRVLGVLVPQADQLLVVLLCVVLLGSSVMAAAFSVVQQLSLLRLDGRFEAVLQSAVWDRLLRLPSAFFQRYSAGELGDAALGISAIREVLSGVAAQLVLGITVGAANLVLLFVISGPLAAVATALILFSALFCVVIGLRQVRYQRELTAKNHVLAGKLFQLLVGLPKLRVAAAEDRAFSFWATGFAHSRHVAAQARRLQNTVTVFNAGYVLICTLVLFALVAGPAAGMFDTAGFVSFYAAFGVAVAAATQVTGTLTTMVAVVPMFTGVRPVVEERPEIGTATQPVGDLSGDIEVSQLTFRYGPDRPVILDAVSVHARPGEFLAVVGPTGCGKSTLLRMLIGFEEPTAGSVLYDGKDLSGLDIAAVRRQCGVVLQNGQLFAGSILSNICGMAGYSLDEAWEAAEMAGLDADIGRMPMGMHTVLSEGAVTLSAGQRQRLMIARALIGRPRILFFDEATSALDNRTQEIVTQSTRRLNATRIVIAHRLSTIMHADRVLVLDGGRVVQNGSPEELLTDPGGLFHQLVRRQVA